MCGRFGVGAERLRRGPSPCCCTAPASLSSLNLEAKALETIYALDLTPQQLKAAEQLAAGAGDQRDRQAGQGPVALRLALIRLGDAIMRGDPEDQIDSLQDDAEEARDGDNVNLDDAVALTATARKRAPDLLKLLTASQVAAYISDCADDISGPLEEILDSLDDLRTAEGDDFTELRDQVADDVALALAGLDPEKDAKISAQVTSWLDRVRLLSPEEFRMRAAELRQDAKTLVGEVDPLDVVRHYLLRDMAELLANPLLPAAIEGRVKFAKE